MRVTKETMVALGYGKYFRADRIVGLVPIEQGRGPGQRTYIYVEGISEPLVASRSESAILRDMVEMPQEVTRAREQQHLLADILDAVKSLDPTLRSIIKSQSQWDLARLEERIMDLLEEGSEG
ncbi:MAG: hypothetical protein Fur0021_38220 [Candidatus Promineifilaceae bacterium]